jgi:hypothetical protein
MIHRRIVGVITILVALGALGCGSAPDAENETDLNAEVAALQTNVVIRTCGGPVATTVGLRCPQPGCCLQKNNFTSPPSYFCYDCF